jgi:autotransporter-associated beta strand protein
MQGLTGNSNFTGTVSVSGGGGIHVTNVADGGSNSNLGAGSSAIALGDASTTGTLWFNNTTTDSTDRGLALGDGGGFVQVSIGGTLTIGGQITGDGSLTKEFSGLLTLGGDNNYTGLTTVTGGSIVVAHDNALGAAAAGTEVVAGARLRLQGGVNVAAENVTTNYLQSVSGDNTWGGTVQNLNGQQLNLESNADLLTIHGDVIAHGVSDGTHTLNLRGAGDGLADGDITGVYGLSKLDGGTWTIAGAAKTWTMTSGVTVAGGELVINTTINGNKNWTVNANATLGGNGTIVAPTVTVNADGTLAPGNSIDQIDITGALTLQGDLLIDVLGASIDRVDVSGLLNLSSATDSLTIVGTLTEAVYVIVGYGSASGSFTFDTLTNLQGYSIDYAYDDGSGANHIALLAPTVIPAPIALPAGMVLMALTSLRRRSR